MSFFTDKNTNRPFIQFQLHGKTYKKRLPAGTSKAEALKIETKWKHDLFFGSALPKEKQAVLWNEFVEDVYFPYVEANNSAAALEKAIVICKAATPFFGGRPINEIKPADVERFKTLRMNTSTQHGHKRMASTIHREMSIISRIFTLAVRNDLCEYNPCTRIDLPKFDNIQNRVLRIEDEDKFLWAIKYRLQRDICLTALYTGLRQDDIFSLRKDQADMVDSILRVKQGKTQRFVTIPMLPMLRDMLTVRMDNHSDLFFPSYRTGGKLTSIRNSIVNACIKAKIPRMTIRDLRRTFGTRLHENGYDDKTVADLLGHVGLRTVHRYKRGTEIKRKAILSLENLAESAKIHASGLNDLHSDSLEPSKTLVEMRRIELLASALRTPATGTIIH